MSSTIAPEKTRIGWIGTGVMGASMCGHLLRAGYGVHFFTRTRSKAGDLESQGAKYLASPAEVARVSDVVLTMVGYPHDVEAIYFGRNEGPEAMIAGILDSARPGTVVVDMTTSEPNLAQRIARYATERGIVALDAPVSGGDIGAREARLSIMVGGDHETFERLAPLWEKMGKVVVHQGPSGAGQHTKMVNQTLIATCMIGVCEALLYAHRAGLNLEQVLRSVSSGAAGSWSLTNYAPRMLRGDFEPGFYVEHFVKDMGIALAEAKRMGLALPGLALAEQLYVALAAQGHARKGTQALALALAHLSNVEWPSA
jgi:3-hydroxyisobutyrate dehydrogenase